ncbi:MAG: glycosyltransferase family 2 protein [Bacteroidaceae bacterium]|nr:glycosyltransferase family 2 protein [Bacteroidaceae bacterium]
MNKILTIIIPTYNMEKYLRKCLDSLIVSDENMKQLEVLVVNDGSKDSSSQIAHEYEARYPQTFRVIDKENGNYGSGINRGLKEATGKYVKVLDADDSFVNDAFDRFLDYLRTKDVDLVINDYCIVDEKDIVAETYTFDLPIDRDFNLGDFPKRMIEWVWHHGITYKTAILLSIDYHQTEGISYTDDEWIFMPMSVVQTVSYFPFNLYHYLVGREGQTFDPKVMKASFDKRIMVGKSMACYYERVRESLNDAAGFYMAEKIQRRLSVIYNFYLTKNYTEQGNHMLQEFDTFLQRNTPSVYQLMGVGKNQFGGKSSICIWREAGYTNTLYLKLRQLKFKMHLMFGKPYRNLHMPDNLRRK